MAIRERRQILRSLYVPGSRKFWSLKHEASRVLFCALVASADDEGRLEGEVEDVKSIVPRAKWSDEVLRNCLSDLARAKLIARYKVDGQQYIQVVEFQESQSWHAVNKDSSRWPAPQSEHQNGGRTSPEPKIEAPLGKVRDVSIHTNQQPYRQTLQTSERESEGKPISADESFRKANRIYRRAVGKGLGSLKPREAKWNEFVKQYGAETVVRAIQIWSREGGKGLRDLRYPLAVFASQGQEWIEAAQDAIEDEKKESAENPAIPSGPMVEHEGKMIPVWLRDEKLKDVVDREAKKQQREQKEKENARLAELAEATPL